MSSALPYVIFDLRLPFANTTSFALNIENVVQIIAGDLPVAVPLAPPMVRGIINLEGRIVTIVDPAPLFNLPAQLSGPTQILLLRREGRAISNLGLMVQRICEIAPHAALHKMAASAVPYVSHVAQLGERAVHMVDFRPLCATLSSHFQTQAQHLGAK